MGMVNIPSYPDPSDKSRSLVSSMFDRLSTRYDAFNAVASFGFDTRWRDAMYRYFPLDLGHTLLDFGYGDG